MESMGEEILREILVKLPTRDLARSSCVSRLWRTVVGEPSFRRLHANAAHVIDGSGGTAAETLLITEIRGLRTRLEAVVLNVSSGKHMCRIADLAGGYSPTNACNGFICLAANKVDWPQYVCNPVTGDKLKIPLPPVIKEADLRLYAMGFSTSAHQYKLFRLSFCNREGAAHYLDVYTLGGHGGWRRNPCLLPYRARYNCKFPPPVLIDGKLFVLTEPPEYYQASDKIIVIDVASEVRCTYHLPKEFKGAVTETMLAFEMSGQLCIALRLAGQRWLHFWVMLPPQGMSLLGSCELRYTFDMNSNDSNWEDKPQGAWFDDSDDMLYYRLDDRLFMYDTNNNNQQVGSSLQWDNDIQLPAAPPQENQRWNVYGGYHPSLVSPRHAFSNAVPSPQCTDEQERFEQALLHALRFKKAFNSKKPFPTNVGLPDRTDDQRAAKRIPEPTH